MRKLEAGTKKAVLDNMYYNNIIIISLIRKNLLIFALKLYKPVTRRP